MTTLRDLGLSEYESRAYQSLLSTGPTTAKELSQVSDVPMGRIYDVLDDLEGTDMVRSQNSSRPKKYVAVPPDKAFERLIERKREAAETELQQFERIANELAENLEAAEPTDPFWTVAIGPDETVDLFLDRLGAATDEITMVVTSPAPQFDIEVIGEQLAETLANALEKGVSVSVLVSPELLEDIPRTMEQRYQRLIREYESYDARVTDDTTTSFTIIDDSEVLIEVPNPLASNEAFALIALTDPEFAAEVTAEFEPHWAAAETYP